MKILFVYPCPEEHHQIPRYQQGIGSISAVLKQAGHRTRLLRLSGTCRAALGPTLAEFKPGLVALSVTSGMFPLACEVARVAGIEHRLPVIMGGIHPTVCPEASIAAEGVTAICRGEGEYAMRDFCAALETGQDPGGIANLWNLCRRIRAKVLEALGRPA